MLLLKQNESMKSIGELLGLPASLARKYATEVKSRMNRAQLQRAADAVTEGGLTVSKAAEQYEVDPEKLKDVLSGHKRKSKNGVVEAQRRLSQQYNSVGTKNARLIKSLIEKFQDGDVNQKQMVEIFKHIERLQKNSAKVTADWKKRFEATVGKSKDPAA
jgi:transposase-like protein